MRKPTGYVLYDGPSMLDGSPIVMIAIVKSKNVKTSNMIQTYILRTDMDPLAANKSGADFAICGDCPHRGSPTDRTDRKLALDRTCYVNMGQGPLIVYRSWKRGIYPDATTANAAADIGAGRNVRVGTYGDGAAVPGYVLDALLSQSSGHTGYSHQADQAGSSYDPSRFMRSVDDRPQAELAWHAGERTFRVVSSLDDIDRTKETLCPASAEAGHRTTCDKCLLCGGNAVKAKSIAIVAHGTGASNFRKRVA